ncbi:hypothetical protein J3Q64DRAFT_1847368 [Phycomyces blakesleeanus]|uniref:STB6-like N-terminal domain-containing protein n=2 Tax=Phycomyces blakesleeanus TaxID=4837 RepID=A0A163AV52_PHYB8|nr:hypothetical protein PHYBLDRAFT_180492 [Phycomyces blakesleeanus NRRL 1555(-)]OAD76031.1 hypothetical protein PHYBLDRAFT_180492 [Phycomyces blakesleeanus NRRL 1555(-)]|eukprot:XP_018294071.1 hypothetical protein PHYBLDRAFT_180492 [Phycomyces blakesleeanus NRRL 1555(-)]
MADIKRFVFVERKRVLTIAATCGLGIVSEKEELQGYQIYIVEQWMCDRTMPSNTVKVFTGDPTHKIDVCVIAMTSADLQHPRPEIKPFFDTGMPLKFKSTPQGDITLTDPSELPYDMDMVLVPNGDFDGWVKQAYVNINLRRSNCTGRSALNLRKPNPASEEKFRSIYKISDAVHFEDAVINLVILAQIALYLFKLLPRDYIDGLVCNDTINAFREFYLNYHPHKSSEYQIKEFWMEPHLLTALITKIIVCRNKLQTYGFTAVKDPFTEFETFRYDIEEFQRVKNLKRTRLIDLETLEKLNEYSLSQLKVRKVLKSKLEDISGANNLPLFVESSDPEVFRRHATLDSLRLVWRPRMKNGFGSDNERQTNEFMHMIKGVSARTSRTTGAAAEILSKVANSLPWTTGAEQKQPKEHRSRLSHKKPTVKIPAIAQQVITLAKPAPSNQQHVPQLHPMKTTSSLGQIVEEDSEVPKSVPGRKASPLSMETYPSSDEDMYTYSQQSTADNTSSKGISEHTAQDLPSFVRAHPPHFLTQADSYSQNLSFQHVHSNSADILHKKTISNDTTHEAPKRLRSVSDSAIRSSAYTHHGSQSSTSIQSSPISPQFSSPVFLHQPNHPLSRNRAYSLIIPSQNNNNITETMLSNRPSIYMDVKTYLSYERLKKQHTALEKTYHQLQNMAREYEKTAHQLRATHQRRFKEFDKIQSNARKVMDDQQETERRLKSVEEDSAKLHYELNVLNDYLKDMEDNVSMFYGKIGMLERKMDDSQQSITTMLIIGNYFRYYWRKARNFLGL